MLDSAEILNAFKSIYNTHVFKLIGLTCSYLFGKFVPCSSNPYGSPRLFPGAPGEHWREGEWTREGETRRPCSLRSRGLFRGKRLDCGCVHHAFSPPSHIPSQPLPEHANWIKVVPVEDIKYVFHWSWHFCSMRSLKFYICDTHAFTIWKDDTH